MPPPAVPSLVKHMTVAIFEKDSSSGDRVERFEKAFTIARSRCVTYDLIGPEGRDDETKIALTAKGSHNENDRRRKPGGREKDALFDALYALHRARKAEKGAGPEAEVPAADPPAAHPQAVSDKLRALESRTPRGREW